MISLGPAGVPLSCKGRTLKDGVRFVHELGLNALEIQFSRGIRIDEEYAIETGEQARELGVSLSVHAPYYTNLGSDNEETVQKSVDKVIMSGHMADTMGASVVICHPGFYTSLSKKETKERITDNATMVRDFFRDSNYKVKLGVEVMGKQQTFGTLEEILELCERVGDGVLPIVDFAHIHARTNGGLKTKADFAKVFDTVEDRLGIETFYTYFTGVRYANNNEICHLPVKKSDLNFDLLGEVILEQGYETTIVSVSPIVEHDAIYMKIRLDRLYEKVAQPLGATPAAGEA